MQSNVWTLAQAVENLDDDVLNVIYYQTGIGSDASSLDVPLHSRIPFLAKLEGAIASVVDKAAIGLEALLQGATGLGIEEKVREAYQFFAINYVKGDEVYIYGFSRGAYTARTVAAFIAKVGALDRTDMNYLNQLFDWFNSLTGDEKGESDIPTDPIVCKILDKQASKPVDVTFLGVFETVGSLGLPDHFVTPGRLNYLGFSDFHLSKQVKVGRHAMAMNENRKDFMVTRWRPKEGVFHPDCKQCWFAGAHGDVGGGFAERDLSAIPLCWMIQETEMATTLRFDHQYIFAHLYKSTDHYGTLRPHDRITQSEPPIWIEKATARQPEIEGNRELLHSSLAYQDLSLWPAASETLKEIVRTGEKVDPVGIEIELRQRWDTLPPIPADLPRSPAFGSFRVRLHKILHDLVYFFGPKEERNVSG